MGTHRGGSRVRRVSKGPVIAVVGIVVVALLAVGWFEVRARTDDEGSEAALACVEGESTLNVTVDPDIAGPIRTIATRYNATNPLVRDHCAKVAVTDRPSLAVADAFAAGTWDDATLGPRPALWIPDSTRAVRMAETPGLLDGDPKPLASSAVVLAVPPALKQALDSAKIGWQDLPQLQQSSLDAVGLTGWGTLGLAMPVGDSTLAVTETVAAAVAGVAPLADDAARSRPVVTAVSSLAAGAPAAATTTDAVAAIDAPDPATAQVHAVATTEQQLRAAGAGLDGYRPGGVGPVADHPATALSGDWVDETQKRTAALFVDYLRRDDQAVALTDAGFQVPAEPVGPVASKDAYRELIDTLTHPVLGINSTVLLDLSSSMRTTDGTQSRLANVAAALRSQLDTVPATSAVGLWTFGKNLDGAKPYKQTVATAQLDADKRSALDTALAGLQATTTESDNAYPSVEAAYSAAVGDYVAGRTNSLLLITDGPDDDSSVTGAQLLAAIGAATDPAKPVRIDVVVIGDGDTSPTVQSLASRTGGTFVKVASSSTPDLGAALAATLG